jgi:hypothetical protein
MSIIANTKIAIIQSNYIPWVGYFDIINSVDEFVILDEVQYTARDWRNRNRILTPNGLHWLTVPVESTKISRETLIEEVEVKDNGWATSHLDLIRRNYKKAPYFDPVFEVLEKAYSDCNVNKLTSVNQVLLNNIAKLMNISTKFSNSRSYPHLGGTKGDRILEICEAAGSEFYVSGPAARGYLDENKFKKKGVNVVWFDYKYKSYKKVWGDTDESLSVIDLLFAVGPDCLSKIRIT